MKAIKVSNEVYARVHQVASENGTTLSQALSGIVDDAGPKPVPPAHPQEAQAPAPSDAEGGLGDFLEWQCDAVFQSLNQLTAMVQALGQEIAEIKAMLRGQQENPGPSRHVHGEPTDCPACDDHRHTELRQVFNNGLMQGLTEMRDYLYQVPSFKYLHNQWEQAKARVEQAQARGEPTVSITDGGGSD